MDGKLIVKRIENVLFEKGISKKDFYADCGLNSTTMSNWRNGVFQPSDAKLTVIENYLGINFDGLEQETELESLREDLRILLRSAKDLPPSSVYELIAQIEKEKENAH